MFYPIPADMRLISPNVEKLGEYDCDGYLACLHRDLDEDGFYADIKITKTGADVCVLEYPDGEEYLPYAVTTNKGAFVTEIRAQVESIIKIIWKEICVLSDARAILTEYMSQKYDTNPETPWNNYPHHETFKTSKKEKWYAIIMEVHYSKLGIDRDEAVNVMNVKAEPIDIEEIIDKVHYFPAYHMNKKYWLSIILDRDLNIDEAKRLIDKSYDLVENPKKK